MDEGQKFYLDIVDDGTYIVVRVPCPNCGTIHRGRKIRSDEEHTEKDIKCKKCDITGFDWSYIPPRVGDAYVRINSCASISAANWEKVLIHNQKRFHLSNA